MSDEFRVSDDGGGNFSRRRFIAGSALAALGAVAGCKTTRPPEDSTASSERILDIHQHLAYHDRTDDVFLAHQRNMGVSRTILLPAGRPVNRPSTHEGVSNGLEAKCAG